VRARLAVATTLLLAVAAPVAADPLRVRDQNPLLRGIYLPLPAPTAADGDGWQLTTGVQWSNTVNIDVAPGEQLVVDAETVELEFGVTRALGAWRFRAGVPVIWRGAGVLDSFIDSWHDVFGLPEGSRPRVPKDAYDVRYERAGRPTVVVRTAPRSATCTWKRAACSLPANAVNSSAGSARSCRPAASRRAPATAPSTSPAG
jgi:hypothetical protein